jgi:16S rRNA (cytosine967-C5)-methyltransferase
MKTVATQPQPVRRLALQILTRIETSGAFADQLIAAVASQQRLAPQARAFLRELTYGVLRWRNRLDWLLERCSERPLAALNSSVRNLLRLGAYQLYGMERIPPYAAVSETVRLAKQVAHPGVVAYVNAVLRSVERQREATSFPEVQDDLMAYLVVTQSHPAWLVERWLRRYGPERTVAMCQANNERPPFVVRANRMRTTPEHMLSSLLAEGCEAELCKFAPEGVLVTSHPGLDQLQCYRSGWLTVQDEAAIISGHLLSPQPGERVLDACAAPGGKATHAAEQMEDRGEVVCLDRSRRRLQLIEENARRLGLESIRCLAGDAERIELQGAFDRILVDAPCSGLGVLRRHPDAKWSKGPELIGAMTRQQGAILEHLSRFVKARGLLVYITCSTETEENQQLIGSFLERHGDFELEPAASYLPAGACVFAQRGGWFQTWPGCNGLDGFFGARMRRRG